MASRNKDLARQRAAEALAAQRKAEARSRQLRIAGGAVVAVVVIVGILIGVKLSGGNSSKSDVPATPASAAIVSDVTGVPAATLNTIGAGKVDVVPKATSNIPVLQSGGKPLIVYIGAEWCPFCAAERWPMVVALSRFGTFSNLGQTRSNSQDVFPLTPTLSFHGATYTSQYIEFQSVELADNVHKTLEKPTSAQQALIDKFDAPPFVPAGSGSGAIPFVDFANQAILSGSTYNPQLLHGLTSTQVAAVLADPNSDIAKAVGGSANTFTKIICGLTNGQPGDVCSSPAVTSAKGAS